VTFLDRITVFDQDNQRIGITYPRRASQLVLKGRAIWQDTEPASIRLVDMLITADDAEEDKHMEISQNVENIDNTNASVNLSNVPAESKEFAEAPTAATPSDDLIMYLAKQNIGRRYDLIRHVILWPVIFIVLLIVTSGFRFESGFYLGFFFAWALLIMYKGYVVISAWLNARPKVDKKDLVRAEYERLKNASPEKIGM